MENKFSNILLIPIESGFFYKTNFSMHLHFSIIRTLVLSFFFFSASAQDSSNISWTSSITKITDSNYEILLKGQIKKGFHIYAKDEADGLSGLTINIKDEAVKQGTLQILSTLKDYADPIFTNSKKIISDNIEVKLLVTISGAAPAAVKLHLTYEVADTENFIPEEQNISLPVEAGAVAKVNSRILISTINLEKPLSDCKVASSSAASSDTKSKGLITLFALGFLGGLVALLTPCVFPMIPLTVSFFTKKATNRKAGIRNAFLYGFFIFFIYVLLSLPFHFLDSLNPEILNNISLNISKTNK